MKKLIQHYALAVLAFISGVALVALIALMPGASYALTLSMDIGSTGSEVRELQTFLAADSSIYPEGLVTGYYGSLTAAAVARWQTAHGISAVGRVGPITLAALNSAMAGSSGSASSNGDVNAPIMSNVVVTPTANSALLTWSTNEPAHSRVMYGTVYPFLYSVAPSVQSSTGLSTVSNVTIPNLNSGTTYYYTLESVDTAGNR